MSTTIDAKDPASKWRFTCPRDEDHHNWIANSYGIYCKTCKRQGRDPYHDAVLDKKTGEHIPWAEVRIEQ